MLLGIWVTAGWGKQQLLPANDNFHHGEDVTPPGQPVQPTSALHKNKK